VSAPKEPDNDLRALLDAVRRGERSVDDALRALRSPLAAAGVLDCATVDHDRARRCGFPEVVFCQGKRPDDAAAIAAEILTRADRVLLTRAEPAHAAAVRARLPHAAHHERARCITVAPTPLDALPEHGRVAIVCAGTSDLPVAEEAAITARIAGNRVETFPDVGVAGLHRLVARLDAIRAANVIVAVAGMEGALPSVLAGLVDKPVIAVPTSVGYGAHFGGLAALLAMMNSCAAGVAVVNVDNGFGAGYLASRINLRTASPPLPATEELPR
jgi:NCAIR mutase (PurE)-related protein